MNTRDNDYGHTSDDTSAYDTTGAADSAVDAVDNAAAPAPGDGDADDTLALDDTTAAAADAEATASYDDELFGTVFTPPPDTEIFGTIFIPPPDAEPVAILNDGEPANPDDPRPPAPAVYRCAVGNHIVFIEQITVYMNGNAMCPDHPRQVLILQPVDMRLVEAPPIETSPAETPTQTDPVKKEP